MKKLIAFTIFAAAISAQAANQDYGKDVQTFSEGYKCALAEIAPQIGLGPPSIEIRIRQLTIAFGSEVKTSTLLEGLVRMGEISSRAYTNQPYSHNRDAGIMHSMNIKFVNAGGKSISSDEVITQLRAYLLTQDDAGVYAAAHVTGTSKKFMQAVRALKPDFAKDISLIRLAEVKQLSNLKTCD